MHNAFEKLKRYKKFLALSNVVLLGSRAAEPSLGHLEQMIHHRLDKEFPNPDEEEAEIIEGVKRENLRFVDRKIKQQRDGEVFTQVLENVRERDVHLWHKFSDPNIDKSEIEIICDALKRAGVNSVTLYIPYSPYQRQDKKDDGRVPISAKLIFDLLSMSLGHRLKRIVTFDLHARQAQGYFDGPLDELSAIPEFAAYYRSLFRGDPNTEVISPDAGGAKRARYLAKLLGTQYQVLDKVRTGHGRAETRFYLPSDVNGKRVILLDDMIDSGSSMVGEFENDKPGPVQYLQSRKAEVFICATHAILSEKNGISAEERMRKAGASVLFTDSLPEKYPGYYEENQDWMQVISLDYTMAKAFYCNQVGESISTFLRHREERLKGAKLDFLITHRNGIVDVE